MGAVITQNLVLSLKDCQVEKPYWSKICWNNKTDSITPSSETVDFEADLALAQNTYQYWLPTAMPATAEITLTGSISFVGIAAHNLADTQTAVKLEYFDGVGYKLIGETFPGDNRAVVFIFDEISASKIRLTFTGSTPPQIGVIQAGDVITMQSNLEPGFVDMRLNRNVTYDDNLSENGHVLGRRIVRTSLMGNPGWKFLRFEWVAKYFYPFMLYSDVNAFFFIPSPQFIPDSAYYCWAKGPIRPTSRNKQFLPIKMSLEAYLG
jgi:hypothetical protein